VGRKNLNNETIGFKDAQAGPANLGELQRNGDDLEFKDPVGAKKVALDLAGVVWTPGDVTLTDANTWYTLYNDLLGVKIGDIFVLMGSYQLNTLLNSEARIRFTVGGLEVPSEAGYIDGNKVAHSMQCTTIYVLGSTESDLSFTLQARCSQAGKLATDIRFAIARIGNVQL